MENSNETTVKTVVVQVKAKDKLIAYLLWFFLGGLGFHRFYAGNIKSGVAMVALFLLGAMTSVLGIGLILYIVLGIWWLIDAFLTSGMIDEANEELTKNA